MRRLQRDPDDTRRSDDVEWFMVKDRVWRGATCDDGVRFLCVKCLENRIGRRLKASDFKRSVRVNFVATKSARLRSRMKGLKPAKRLRNRKVANENDDYMSGTFYRVEHGDSPTTIRHLQRGLQA